MSRSEEWVPRPSADEPFEKRGAASDQLDETTALTVNGPAIGLFIRLTNTTSVFRPVVRPTMNVRFRISIPPDDADHHSLDHHFF